MVFTVAVGVAKTINFSYTITLSTCPIHVGFKPTVVGSSFCITINDIKNLIVVKSINQFVFISALQVLAKRGKGHTQQNG